MGFINLLLITIITMAAVGPGELPDVLPKPEREQEMERRQLMESKGVNSRPGPKTDAQLAKEIREQVQKDPTLSTTAKKIAVSATNGRVTISGTVLNEMERARVTNIARKIAGEDNVITDLTVQ